VLPEKLRQYIVQLHKFEYKSLYLLKILEKIVTNDPDSKILVFTASLKTSNRLVRLLKLFEVDYIQEFSSVIRKKELKLILKKFVTTKEIKCLICTDILGRGFDSDKVKYVINYDLPFDTETYVHRVGIFIFYFSRSLCKSRKGNPFFKKHRWVFFHLNLGVAFSFVGNFDVKVFKERFKNIKYNHLENYKMNTYEIDDLHTLLQNNLIKLEQEIENEAINIYDIKRDELKRKILNDKLEKNKKSKNDNDLKIDDNQIQIKNDKDIKINIIQKN
jgi:superfamily II DNA/RNA helicase